MLVSAGTSTEAESKPNSVNQIQIVKSTKDLPSPTGLFQKNKVEFAELLRENRLNFRQSRRLREQVDDHFANGFY